MKAVVRLIIGISLLIGVSMSAYASESQEYADTSTGEADVYGYYQDPVFEEGYYIGEIENGFSEVYPDIGVTISGSLDAAYDDLKFVIVDVSRFYDEATLESIEASFDEGATVIPFYIFYVDEYYATVEIEATYTLTITAGDDGAIDFREYSLYYLGQDGGVEKLDTVTDANRMTYSGALAGDFVFANSISTEDENDDTANNVVKTGDGNRPEFWLIVLVSACICMGIVTENRRSIRLE